MSEAEQGKGAVRWAATVDQVGEHTVVLDVDGVTLKVPRELLGAAGATVREGDGFTLSIEPSAAASDALRASVQGRIAALAQQAGGAKEEAAAPPVGSPVGLGAMPGVRPASASSDGSNEAAIDLARDDDAEIESERARAKREGEEEGGDGST